jgi:integrase
MARRNAKDRGIVEKPQGSGKWWVRHYVEGLERWHKCDSKSQARTLYGRLKAETREGRLFPKTKAVKPVLLNEYFKTWLNNQPAKGKKTVTIKTYVWRLQKHVLPVFGRSPLSAITRPQVKAWAATLLKKGLSFDTALNTLLTLSAVLTEAVEDGLIAQNPALRSGKLLKRPSTLEDQDLAIFTPEEEHLLLETVQRERPQFYPMALTFFRTGLRAGEVLGLHRGDLNFRNRTIHVQRNWSHGELGTPKNGKGRRVDMSQGLANALTGWIELQDLEAGAEGRPSPEILFPGNVGGTRRAPSYMAENWLRYKLWFPLIEKAGIRRLDLHSTRHTYASRLIANGENLKYIQEQLGHASITITCDTYGHLIPGGNRQAVDRLDTQLIEVPTGSKTGSNSIATL